MVLTIDVGNTNIAFGLHHRGRWVDHWRLRTHAEQTTDEYLVVFHNLLEVGGHRRAAIRRIVISSVVPALTTAITAMAQRLCPDVPPLVVNHKMVTGLNPNAEIPGELGNDLLANAVAAYHRFRAATIVVDFGTALTFVALSDYGDILGVSIAPGLRSAVRALSSSTAQLPAVELSPPPGALGRTTTHAIQSGIVFGYVGLIREVVHRMSREMEHGGAASQKPQVIATGGLAETFAPLTEIFHTIDQWHTLEGLRILGELNPAE